MLRNNYINPMTKVYQYEYALYIIVADLFKAVECNSRCIERLKLYYAELVRENRNTGHISYEKQYEIEDNMQKLVNRDVIGKVDFPAMHKCKAEVSVMEKGNGYHMFIFYDGIYGFSASLRNKEVRNNAGEMTSTITGIEVKNFIEVLDGPESNNETNHTAVIVA